MPVSLTRPHLRLRFADGSHTTVRLREGVTSVGTSQAATVTLDGDRYAAPVHALVVVEDGRIVVREARSVKGVYFRVGAVPIAVRPGDQLLVGSTLVTIEDKDDGEQQAP